MKKPETIRLRNQPNATQRDLGTGKTAVCALSVKVGWLAEHHSWEADCHC